MSLPSQLEIYIERQTNPPWTRLAMKLTAIQFVTSLITLTLCPQFGISPLGVSDGLRNIFMLLGHHWCEFLCGLFYAFSFFISFRVLFNTFEIRKLTQHFWILQSLIAMGSVGFLLMWTLSLAINPWTILSNIHSWWIFGYCLYFLFDFSYQKIWPPNNSPLVSQ